MASNQLAAQMYTLRDFTKTAEGFDACLQTLHAIGYAGVQLSAIGCMNGDAPEVDAKMAREMLDSHGLLCVATHRPEERLVQNTAEEIAFHQTLGCDYVAVSGAWKTGDRDAGYREFVAQTAGTRQALAAAGIQFGYHNHSHEFIRDADTKEWVLAAVLDDPTFQLEVDTYWIQHAGLDPAKFLLRYAGRVDVIHMKDKEVVSKDGPVMAPVGEGNMDWDAIVAAGRDAGVRWYVVEQDDCRRDPFDCLASSFEFLSAYGLAG
jgi:sugar phosphate isomerase/epimerase